MKKTKKIILATALVAGLFSPVAVLSYKALADETSMTPAAEVAEEQKAAEKSTEEVDTNLNEAPAAEAEKPAEATPVTPETTPAEKPAEETPAADKEAEKPEATPETDNEKAEAVKPADTSMNPINPPVNPDVKGGLMVNYVESGTNQHIMAGTFTQGKPGDPYTVKAKEIAGYELDRAITNNSEIRNGTYTKATRTETFYYKKIDHYISTAYHFDANDGSGRVITTNALRGGAAVVFPTQNDMPRDGYVLVGWSSEKDGSGDFYDPGATINTPRYAAPYANEENGTQDITFYAVWAAIETNIDPDEPDTDVNYVGMSIRFDANGGQGTPPATIIVKYGDTFVMPSADGLSKKGYHFVGWNREADGSGISYQPGDKVQAVSAHAKSTTYAVEEAYSVNVLYAMWAPGEAPVAATPTNTTKVVAMTAGSGQQLPKTGEAQGTNLVLFGALAVIAAAGLVVVGYRVKKA